MSDFDIYCDGSHVKTLYGMDDARDALTEYFTRTVGGALAVEYVGRATFEGDTAEVGVSHYRYRVVATMPTSAPCRDCGAPLSLGSERCSDSGAPCADPGDITGGHGFRSPPQVAPERWVELHPEGDDYIVELA